MAVERKHPGLRPAVNEPIEHFFRHEYSRMVAVIARYFGTGRLDEAEDIVQETLLEATRAWDYGNLPENPGAWLYKVAKNKALNVMRGDRTRTKYQQEIYSRYGGEVSETGHEDIFQDDEVLDAQLRMMFVCCRPTVNRQARIALILKTLCGFSISEIARALLTTNETINKRLTRARKVLRETQVKESIQFEIPDASQLANELPTILNSIYLLFNEGYNAGQGEHVLRLELCQEAIRLGQIVAANKNLENHGDVNALLALMFLNASRFEARQDEAGAIIPLADQDRSVWNQMLISKGLRYLEKIKRSPEVSTYHFLAAISAHHCSAPSFRETDWPAILSLYDKLTLIDSSPIVLLNRAVALAKVKGAAGAVRELQELESLPGLKNYHLLYTTLAELYMEQEMYAEAARGLNRALRCTAMEPEIRRINAKLDICEKMIA